MSLFGKVVVSTCPLSERTREKKGIQNLAGRVDGGTVGTEDIKVVLYFMFYYVFCPMCSDKTILFPFELKTGEVTLLMALGNLTMFSPANT